MLQSDKKQKKRSEMFSAAYSLFSKKGIHETSIDDIVREAKVAKGTFYLYFKDKYDLIDRLITRKGTAVIGMAVAALDAELTRRPMDFEERFLFFLDRTIGILAEDPKLLTLLHKNLSWGLMAQTLQDEAARAGLERFCTDYMATGHSRVEAEQTLYLIVEMVGGVCYSTAIEKKPCTLSEIRPILHGMIRKMLR